MSLASSIAALAARIGFEVKTKIDATHPGIARVWVSFGYVGGQVVIAARTTSPAWCARRRVGTACISLWRCRMRITAGRHSPAAAPTPASSALALVRTSSDLKTAQYVDISCATAALSFDDSSEINLVVYR
jgi:hypothetical protein